MYKACTIVLYTENFKAHMLPPGSCDTSFIGWIRSISHSFNTGFGRLVKLCSVRYPCLHGYIDNIKWDFSHHNGHVIVQVVVMMMLIPKRMENVVMITVATHLATVTLTESVSYVVININVIIMVHFIHSLFLNQVKVGSKRLDVSVFSGVV